MVYGVEHSLIRVRLAAEHLIIYNGQSVREHCHLLGVFHYVFFAHRAHKLPAFYVLHSVEICKKIVTHTNSITLYSTKNNIFFTIVLQTPQIYSKIML